MIMKLTCAAPEFIKAIKKLSQRLIFFVAKE